MGIRFKGLTSALAIFTTVGVSSTAMAQTAPTNQFSPYTTVADRFEQVFFTNDKDFFANRSFVRQLDLIFGFGSLSTGFIENEANADTKAINIFYKDALLQQGSSDPVIRTRDLPNPYDTSVLQSPRLNVTNETEPAPPAGL